MKKVLFVCLGNIARSQMAEAYYNYFTDSIAASSAGVLDFTPTKYGHPVKEVIQVMKEDNISVAQKKVKVITEKMIEDNDKIFIMCRKEECPHFLLKSNKIAFWDVEDPFDTDLNNFRKTRDKIKAKIKKLIKGIEF
jgi:arsenate reductase